MNLLITSGRRRVSLIRAFRAALNGKGLVYVTDGDATSPALYVGDAAFLSPWADEPTYVDVLLERVQQHQIAALIPLIDREVPLLAAAASRFHALGCRVLTMDAMAANICADKWLTAQFFARAGIPHPATFLPSDDGELPVGAGLPLIVKPRRGSGSRGVSLCYTQAQVVADCGEIRDPLLQEAVSGDEITVDVLGDLDGRVINAVQRQRLKVRAGEVERGVTIRDAEVELLAVKAAEALKPVGCINLQCFRTSRGVQFTEINPRFGGGYPLAQAAGANYPELLIQALEGGALTPAVGAYETGVHLLRYDEAIVLRQGELLDAQGCDL